MRAALLATLLALMGLLALGCESSDTGGPIVDSNETGGIATSGGGNPFDQVNPGDVGPDLSKSDGNAYAVPSFLPPLEDPRIVVSLAGFTVELIDEATGFHKVYPTGVGALGSSGRSYTPVGEFTTHPDPNDTWFWYARRYRPEYFDGLPFMRITARNSAGNQTYGFHGPITGTLQRGYVSHGCMRMRPDDIVELFWMMRRHPGAKVSIQAEKRYTEEGELIDVTPPELDPVAAWQAMACAESPTGKGELIEAGSFAEHLLCDGAAKYRIALDQGDKVQVTVKSRVPVSLQLAQGDALEEVEAVKEDGDYRAVGELRVGEAGEVVISVLGDPSSFDLTVDRIPFGSPEPADGWIGDGCSASLQCGDLECLTDLPGGLCSEVCERFCPDRAGAAATFCVDLGFSDGGRCVAACAGDGDCREGYACTEMPRFNEPETAKTVCVPTR